MIKNSVFSLNLSMEKSVRIDKWLWAVRIFKTRGLACDACKAGKVKIEDNAVKPSRDVKIGEIITVQIGPLKKTIMVLAALENRVSAKLAVGFVQDMTPEEEYKKLELMRDSVFIRRDRGAGRPTKKERRDIQKNTDDF